MRKPTRSQRLKEFRKTRYKRAMATLEGKNTKKSKMSRGNRLVLIVIIFVFFVMNFYSIRYINRTFDFSLDDFKNNYDEFIADNNNEFIYDKKIKDVIINNKEYSFLQNSSVQTANLIAVYQYTDKVKRIGVVGIYRDDDVFNQSYLENMSVIVSIVSGKKLEESLEYLRKLKFIDDDNVIIKREKKYKKQDGELSMSIVYRENSLVFAVEK